MVLLVKPVFRYGDYHTGVPYGRGHVNISGKIARKKRRRTGGGTSGAGASASDQGDMVLRVHGTAFKANCQALSIVCLAWVKYSF